MLLGVVIALGASLAQGLRPASAHACGCLSPPIPPPMPGAVDFAVNQQSEQIIFEVEPDGHVVAHVLIRYAGRSRRCPSWSCPIRLRSG